MKLTPLKAITLAEIFQSLDIKFSFVNNKYEEMSFPAKCRDFLGDCIWSQKTKNYVNIYGFKYSYKKTPYDLEKLRLSLLFPTEKEKEYFLNNIHILNSIEEKYGLEKTTILHPEDSPKIVLEADKNWQDSSWKLSLYTFYIKKLSYKDITKLQEPENEYNNLLTKEKEDLLLQKIKTPTKYIAETLGTQHNATGFVTILKNKNLTLATEIFGET